MTTCTTSLASAAQRATKFGELLACAMSPVIKIDWTLVRMLCFLQRLPCEIKLFYAAFIAEQATIYAIKEMRRKLALVPCPAETCGELLADGMPIIQQWDTGIKQACEMSLPGYIIRRMEGCRDAWIDFVEDLEVSADNECQSLFGDLAAELTKRQ